MKRNRLLLFLISIFSPIITFAQETAEQGLDDKINELVAPAAGAVAEVVFYGITIAGMEIPIVLIVLIGAATYFTIYFGFPNFTKFGLAIKPSILTISVSSLIGTNFSFVLAPIIATIRCRRLDARRLKSSLSLL